MRNKKKIFLNKILMNRYTMKMKLKNNKKIKIFNKKIKKRKLIKKIYKHGKIHLYLSKEKNNKHQKL